MSNPPRPADALEAANRPAELTQRALAAVVRAVACANNLGLYADDKAPRSALSETLLREDIAETARALDEAARLLDAADPLGCIDTSEAHAELAEGRLVYLASLTALGLSASGRAA